MSKKTQQEYENCKRIRNETEQEMEWNRHISRIEQTRLVKISRDKSSNGKRRIGKAS